MNGVQKFLASLRRSLSARTMRFLASYARADRIRWNTADGAGAVGPKDGKGG